MDTQIPSQARVSKLNQFHKVVFPNIFFCVSDTSENTPSRSGLRKRKRPETPQKTEKQVSEEWVDEDQLQLWEIRLFGER